MMLRSKGEVNGRFHTIKRTMKEQGVEDGSMDTHEHPWNYDIHVYILEIKVDIYAWLSIYRK